MERDELIQKARAAKEFAYCPQSGSSLDILYLVSKKI